MLLTMAVKRVQRGSIFVYILPSSLNQNDLFTFYNDAAWNRMMQYKRKVTFALENTPLRMYMVSFINGTQGPLYTHTHVHTHIYIYIYILCVCVCVYRQTDRGIYPFTHSTVYLWCLSSCYRAYNYLTVTSHIIE